MRTRRDSSISSVYVLWVDDTVSFPGRSTYSFLRHCPQNSTLVDPASHCITAERAGNHFASSPHVNKAFRYTYSVLYLKGAVPLNVQSFSGLKPTAHLRYSWTDAKIRRGQ